MRTAPPQLAFPKELEQHSSHYDFIVPERLTSADCVQNQLHSASDIQFVVNAQ